MPWAGLKMRRRGNVFMAWYRDPPRATKRHIDACLNAARDHRSAERQRRDDRTGR